MTPPCPEFIWDNETRSEEITWEDVCREWGDILFRLGPPDLQSNVGFFLSRLDCLVEGDYATVEDVVDFLKTWRSDWPQLDDPAFDPIDKFLNHPGLIPGS